MTVDKRQSTTKVRNCDGTLRIWAQAHKDLATSVRSGFGPLKSLILEAVAIFSIITCTASPDDGKSGRNLGRDVVN